MKVTKKVTTTIIGCVTSDGISTTKHMDFNGGRDARRILRERMRNGEKVFIDSVNTEKCLVELEDSVVFENATFRSVKDNE